MKLARLLLVVVVLTAVVPASAETPRSDLFLRAIQQIPGQPVDDLPEGASPILGVPDTVWFGGHDGEGYAVEGGVWDFDDGTLQGWYGVDLTLNHGETWGKRVTPQDFECPDQAPMILGTTGQLWFGMQQSTADAECWVCDAGLDCSLGYKNNLCQRVESPALPYSGGHIALEFIYFLDCEGYPYDYVKAQVVALEEIPPGELSELDVLLVGNVDDGLGGIIGDPQNPAAFYGVADSTLFPVETDAIRIRFEFLADGGWSDADSAGGICSTYGPFGADSVVVSESGVGELAVYDFDDGDPGWVSSHCPGVGDFVEVNPVTRYTILDPCDCDLSGYVLSMHDENLEHPGDPDGSGGEQHSAAVSPIIDRTAYSWEAGFNDIFLEADLYALLPLYNGVLYRPGMYYYPWTCDESGASGWSPREGQRTWFYVGEDPVCYRMSNNFTADGIPTDADLYRAILELLSCCACFGIDPEECTNETNETPLYDNIQVGITQASNAPAIRLDTWGFQDAFTQYPALSPYETGRCDDAHADAGVQPPYILADSLAIWGPVVSDDTPSWEARLWFRVQRKGPEINESAYQTWASRFPADPAMGFVSALMDSCQIGDTAFKNRFCTYFQESDPGFHAGFPEFSDENEILPDDLFTPGTRIEYFISSNWIGSGEFYLLPDTTGGRFLEFEILPTMRIGEEPFDDYIWPCVLYVDAFNRGAEPYIEAGLQSVIPEIPGDGPNHDRYDELGASSNFNASSLYRIPGGNNGATWCQLSTYVLILVNTGEFGAGAMEESDMVGLERYLDEWGCDNEWYRRGLIMNGDEIAGIVEHLRPSFLTGFLGTWLECSPYSESDCPPGTDSDSSYCVAVIDAPGGGYPPAGDYYAFGNGCPDLFDYSVLEPTTGIGNRNWDDYDGTKGTISFAQILNDVTPDEPNYRTIIDGYSYHHITTTFNSGDNECEGDVSGRVDAVEGELGTAFEWIFQGTTYPGWNQPTGSDAPEEDRVSMKVDRLFQNEPNPFNPRTAIRFSTARRGAVQLSIYDASGRMVKRVLENVEDAGLHTVVWDGTDSKGHRVGSGVYWSQLRAGDYVSSKKMLLLR